MYLQEVIVIAIIALIIFGAVMYIVKAKKSGQKCIGCPYSKTCNKNDSNSGSCCSCDNENKI